MGRPLNKKYFGNRNIGSTSTTADDGIGGEGVASVTIGGSWSGFTQATSTVIFSAPQLPGGVTATGTVTITAGAPTLVTITEKGSGYTSAPTVTIADSDVGAETTGTATAVLTTNSGNVWSSTYQENAITCYAYVPTANGGSSRVVGDIIKQVSTNRYKVKTAQGTGICKLVTDGVANAGGEMDITAYDTGAGGSNEYWVSKLTSRTVTLVSKGGGSGGTDFTNGRKVKWTFGSAVAPSGADIGTAKIQNA